MTYESMNYHFLVIEIYLGCKQHLKTVTQYYETAVISFLLLLMDRIQCDLVLTIKHGPVIL